MTLSPAYLQKGEEGWETFYSNVLKAERVQYDYRDHDGQLFSCIDRDLWKCRARRDEWIRAKAH